MDAISKQEAALALTKVLPNFNSDQIVRIMNVANWILDLTDEEIVSIVQAAKDINAVLPAEASFGEKKQIHRAVIHIAVEPADSVINALGLKATIKA